MSKDNKNPFDSMSKAETNYLKMFNDLIKEFTELENYIKPFVQQNEKYSKLLDSINAKFVALPISHIVINTTNKMTLEVIKSHMNSMAPPLKIKCPTCKKVVWDISQLKDFLDPTGTLYKNKEDKK